MGDSFSRFLAGQQAVYDRFDQGMAIALEAGVLPDRALVNCVGGYLIALDVPGMAGLDLGLLSASMARVRGGLPVCGYQGNLHTTVADLVRDNFDPVRDDSNRASTLTALSEIVAEVVQAVISPILTTYRDVVFNQTTCIAKGYPDQGFIDFAEAVVATSATRGFGLRLPWGAHTTLARFGMEYTSDFAHDFRDNLVAMQRYCAEHPTLRPECEPFPSVVVGDFALTQDTSSFFYRVHRRIPLPT